MFKFGFSSDNSNDVHDNNDVEQSRLNWIDVREIDISSDQYSRKYNECDFKIINMCDIDIKLLRSDNVMLQLKNSTHNSIIKAESQHSDLLPAVYEGGLKVWECSYDLGNYLLMNNIELNNRKLLDLGCGTGILGIIALLRGATVHFQDYNREVIESLTIPNVLLNSNGRDYNHMIADNSDFYAGDWASFTQLSSIKYPTNDKKYDIILSSETMYNSDNLKKLYQVFKERLNNNGVGYICGKSYYFGVGGGMRQFEDIIKHDNIFNIENVWTSRDGLQREIIKLTRQHN